MSKIMAENIDEDKIIDYFLADTAQEGKFPTDPSLIIESLDLQQLEFDFAEEFGAFSKKRLQRYRALLSYDEKVIALNSSEHKRANAPRVKFSLFHEIAHYVIPEHIEKFYLCSEEDMSEKTAITLEAEANRLAADFIYQKNTFTEEANQYLIEAKSIFTLKDKYGVSYESASRRFVERHILPCALVAYGRSQDDEWDVMYTITSPIFKERFFSKVIRDDKNPRIQEIINSMGIEHTISDTVSIDIMGEGKRKFDAEYFYNQCRGFALIKPRGK